MIIGAKEIINMRAIFNISLQLYCKHVSDNSKTAYMMNVHQYGCTEYIFLKNLLLLLLVFLDLFHVSHFFSVFH